MKITAFITHSIVDCWNFLPRHKAALEKALPGTDVRICETKDQFLGALSETHVALIWGFQQEWFDLAPRLNWIVTPAAGKDYFQVTPPHSVAIDYCSFHGEIMAETVVAYVLAHNRGISENQCWQDKKPWPRGEIANKMRVLRGNSIVILGFGHIGQWIGRLLKPFGVKITGVKRELSSAPDYFGPEDKLVSIENWESCLGDCDQLILALPRSPQTDNIINHRILAQLPSRAAIHNIGRGNAIDEQALAEALTEKKLAAAYLDVFQQEPLPEDSPLRDAPNCLLMPHISACSPNYLDLFVNELIGKFKAKYPDQF